MMQFPKALGRPTVAEIDLKSLEYNYWQLKKRFPEGVKLLAVVKADAYGHGIKEVSRVALKNGADWLSVSSCLHFYVNNG